MSTRKTAEAGASEAAKPDAASKASDFVTVKSTAQVDGVFYGPGQYRRAALPDGVAAALSAKA